MKKYISFFITVLLMVSSLSACSTVKTTIKQNAESLQIVTTIFPIYDWVRNILGDNPADAKVTMLLGQGVDLHSYQATAEDIMKISNADVFIYVGGESDEWVEDALQEATNKDMVVINLLQVLGDAAKEEEVVEGMQEEEHDHNHDDSDEQSQNSENVEKQNHDHEKNEDEDHDHEKNEEENHEHDKNEGENHEHQEGEVVYDEHIWLSLRNASTLCDAIADALASIDVNHADVYESNVMAYKESLNALDNEYENVISDSSVKTLLFGDRFPFRYLVDDYGLDYYAAFVGCSAETEASFETITFLANKVDELSLSHVMTIEGAKHRIAETIVESTKTKDQQILTLDSMQSTTTKDAENGATYLSIMESNLKVLKEVLK